MISCDQYDYIEIACTFRYPIKLTMKSGKEIAAIACDTKINDYKEECIEIDVTGAHTLVVLNDISILEVCIENPHFKTIAFD